MTTSNRYKIVVLKTSATALFILTALFISAEIKESCEIKSNVVKMSEDLLTEIKSLIDDLKAE